MIYKVPLSLRNSATSNIENFIRDIACVARTGISPYFRKKDRIKECIKSYRNPFNGVKRKFDDDFMCKPEDNFYRYMHIDLSKNGDSVGISMCHIPEFRKEFVRDEVTGGTMEAYMPVVRFDFWGRLTAPRNEEIILSDVREIIYTISKRKFYINLITFDRFQSLDSIQILRSNNYKSENLSIDRTSNFLVVDQEAENKLKKKSTNGNTKYSMMLFRELIYQRRLEVPDSTGIYEKDYFYFETEQAQDIGPKVDHPPKGSIDVLQSMVGAALNAVANEKYVEYNETESDIIKRRDSYYEENRERISEIDRYLSSGYDSFGPRNPLDIA